MSFLRFAARDLGLAAVAAGAWWGLAARSGGDGPVADFAGFVAGALVGLSAYAFHEWGHLLAALAGGSAVRPARRLASPFLFRFDPRANSLRQFVAMSLGGFAATAAAVWGAYALMPDGLLASRVARGAVGFLAFLALVLEVPLLAVALVRGGVPEAAAVPVAPASGGSAG